MDRGEESANECLKQPTNGYQVGGRNRRSFRHDELDRNIKAKEQEIGFLNSKLSQVKKELTVLKKARKSVTPEMEAAIRTLDEVGMI